MDWGSKIGQWFNRSPFGHMNPGETESGMSTENEIRIVSVSYPGGTSADVSTKPHPGLPSSLASLPAWQSEEEK